MQRWFYFVTLCWIAIPSAALATKPTPAQNHLTESRVWTDSSGRFTTTASFVKHDENAITLRKSSGEIVRVSIQRLSQSDQRFVHEIAGSPTAVAQTAQGIIDTVKGAGRTVKSGFVLMRVMGRLAEPERRTAAKPVLPSEDAMPSDLLYVHISRKALAGGLDRPIARRTSVRETIVGTPVVGTALTNASTNLRLVPAQGRAVLDLVFHGRVDSQTTGNGGPVQVHSGGVTHFNAVKRVILDEQGIQIFPSRVAAQTSTTIHGVSTDLPRLRGRIARRIGSRRASELKPAAEAEAARKAEVRLASEFDREVADQLKSSHGKLARIVSALPFENKTLRGRIQFATSADYLQLVVHRAAGERSPARPPAPSAIGSPQWAVHVHSSLVDEVMQSDERGSLEALINGFIANHVQQYVGTLRPMPSLQLKQSDDGAWWSLVVPSGASTAPDKPAAQIAGVSAY